MQFEYSATDATGHTSEGRVDADTRALALAQLARRGLQVRRLGPLAETANPGAKPVKPSTPGRAATGTARATRTSTDHDATRPAPPGLLPCSQRQVERFTAALADLLGAGMPLDASLGSLARRSRDPRLAALAARLQEKVRDGVPLSRAIAECATGFGHLYCELIKAGEHSGSLTDILRRQSTHLATMARLRSRLVTALIYPAALLVAGTGVAILFLFFLLPRLVLLLESAAGGLPRPVALVVELRQGMIDHWLWLVLALLLGLALLVLAFRHQPWTTARHRLALSLPVVGRVIKTRFAVRYLEALATLLGGGVRVEQALALAARATANLHLRQMMLAVRDDVADGRQLADALEKTSVFPDLAIDLIQVGENTGRLTLGVARAAGRLDEELGEELERASALAGPAVITVMAVLVGGMAYVITSSVFDTISALRAGQ